jgi:hypothetical protein
MQLIMTPIGGFILFIFLITFFPLQATKDETYDARKRQKFYAILLLVGILTLAALASGLAAIIGYVHHMDNDTMRYAIIMLHTATRSEAMFSIYARVIGAVSAICVIVHWSPQIYRTWKLKVRAL